jgi:MFS family permease
MGIGGVLIALVLFLLLPKERIANQRGGSIGSAIQSFGIVFRNPQSVLCGIIAGLLFLPTTIFDMTWGVRFLQEAHGFDYGAAVVRSATVPFGWIIGCPILGWLSDRLGRRKPVILGGACVTAACLAWILYGPRGVLPPYVLGIITGFGSGAAMIPYTIIKEANPPNLSGTATGVINFLNLSLTALLGPVFGWLLQSSAAGTQPALEHYQSTFLPLLFGVGAVLLLTLLLKETGSAVSVPIESPEVA